MAQIGDGVEIVDALVVTLDICSSSILIEDLMKNDRSDVKALFCAHRVSSVQVRRTWSIMTLRSE
jgi:hypothetical protein